MFKTKNPLTKREIDLNLIIENLDMLLYIFKKRDTFRISETKFQEFNDNIKELYIDLLHENISEVKK